MRQVVLYILPLLILQLLPGCRKSVGKTELMSYLNDPQHKLVVADSSDGFNYKVYFKPSDLIAVRYLSKHELHPNIDSLRKAHENYLYFNLCLSYQGKDLFAQQIPGVDFGGLQKRVSFGLEPYISLTDNQGKSYKLVDYSYARLYAMTTSTNILLVFKNEALDGAHHYALKIGDFVTDTPDQLLFTFYKKDILNAPGLNFDLL